MSKPLFDNVGRELKIIAETIARWIIAGFVIVALLITIAGIATSVELDSGWYAFISIAISIFLVVYGCIKARLQVIKLYAYGDLVEKVTSIDSKVRNKTKNIAVPVPVKDKSEEDSHDAPKVERNQDGTWVCLYCDHKNHADAKWCVKCGFRAEFK